jgi:hypothetical protein
MTLGVLAPVVIYSSYASVYIVTQLFPANFW